MITTFINALTGWLSDHPWAVILMGALSLFTVLATLVIVPILIVRIPADFFAHTRPPKMPWDNAHPSLRAALIIGKNVLAIFLILAGIVLSLPLVPGPGVLTILAGLALADIPGKRRAEQWIVSRKPVFDSLNKLRHKHGQPPLEHPHRAND